MNAVSYINLLSSTLENTKSDEYKFVIPYPRKYQITPVNMNSGYDVLNLPVSSVHTNESTSFINHLNGNASCRREY